MYTVAQFGFSQTTYVVGESNGPAMPAIVLLFGELTFPIDVDVSTVAGGSATSIYSTHSIIGQTTCTCVWLIYSLL